MTLAETAGQIIDHLERTTGSFMGQVDDPGVVRLAMLIGDAQVLFLDAAGAPAGGGRFAGTIVVMTDTLVMRWVRPVDPGGEALADSVVEAWARSTVNQIAVLGPDDAFHRATESRPLPTGCQIELSYEGGHRLSLPLRPEVGRDCVVVGGELLPRVREELARRTSST